MENSPRRRETLKPEYFEKSDYLGYFKQVLRQFGTRALYKQFRKTVRRPFSRNLINQYAPHGFGIEIGVGNQSIAPVSRTILADAFQEHAGTPSWAKLYFDGGEVPFDEGTFDFILTEHVLEHISNPIKSLKDWRRVLKPGGVLFLFLPHKERTFDRLRERTTLQHLKEDEKSNVPPDDSTHLAEWMENVISKGLAPHYGQFTPEQMVKRGCLHHHAWVTADIVELLRFVGFEILYECDTVPDRTDSFVVVARK